MRRIGANNLGAVMSRTPSAKDVAAIDPRLMKRKPQIDETAPITEVNMDHFTEQGRNGSATGSGLKVANGAKAYIDSNGEWRNALGYISAEHHRHVAKVWAEKCVSLNDVYKGVRADARKKEDYTLNETSISVFGENNNILISGFELPKTIMTTEAVMQLGRLCQIKQGTIENLLELNEADHLAALFNTQLQKRTSKRDKDCLIRLRDRRAGTDAWPSATAGTVTESEKVVRGVLTEQFDTYDNHEIFAWLAEAIGMDGIRDGLTSHFFDDGDDISGIILLPDHVTNADIVGPDSDYGIAVSIRNSEVGRFKLVLRPSLFRAICMNGLHWSGLDCDIFVDERHVKGGLTRAAIKARFIAGINACRNHGKDLYTQLMQARTVTVAEVKRVVAVTGLANGLTSEQASTIFHAWSAEPERTAAGIVNAYTRGAQLYTGGNRVKIETIAGTLLTPALKATPDDLAAHWNNWSTRANMIDEKKVDQYVRVGR